MSADTSIPMSAEAAQSMIVRSLELWDIAGSTYSILRHNENLACRVQDRSGSEYLLRICQPRTTALAGKQQTVAAIESEMAWLLAVGRDTGLPVQRPVASTRDRYIETVSHPEEGRQIPVLLLTWTPGEMLTQKEPDAERLLREVGRVQRSLHEQAKHWAVPADFNRPFYDESALLREVQALEKGVQPGLIRKEHYQLVLEATDVIVRYLQARLRTPDVWGPIHMDWMGNLVVSEGSVVPIDFSLSGLGFYLQDVGQCICNVKKPLRTAYLDGYRTSFSAAEQLEISAYVLMIILITAGRNLFNPEWREWIQVRRFPIIVGEFCPKLLAGEPFHLDL